MFIALSALSAKRVFEKQKHLFIYKSRYPHQCSDQNFGFWKPLKTYHIHITGISYQIVKKYKIHKMGIKSTKVQML